MAQVVFSLDSPGFANVAPPEGWNASFSSQERLRWANLYTYLLKKGRTGGDAHRLATMKTFQLQNVYLKYSAKQEMELERAFKPS